MNLRGAILVWLAAVTLLPLAGGEVASSLSWEQAYGARIRWWSLQPIRPSAPPAVKDATWPRNFIDGFILASLEDTREIHELVIAPR